MTTERTKPITIKTDADAIAYLKTQGIYIEADPTFALDKNGKAFVIREHFCRRCGGAGYSRSWHQDGGICYECQGKNSRYKYSATVISIAKKTRKRELRAAAKVRKAERKQAAFEARVAEARTEFDAKFPHVTETLAGATHTILVDLREKLDKWGSLSEKQVALIDRLVAEANAPKAKLEGGRRELTGKVLSCKWRSSQYGGAFKMTLDLGDGSRVWGTVPAALEDAVREYHHTHVKDSSTFDLPEVLKGATVTITATVNVSDDDESFGFFKRPSNPVLAGVAWVSPEPIWR